MHHDMYRSKLHGLYRKPEHMLPSVHDVVFIASVRLSDDMDVTKNRKHNKTINQLYPVVTCRLKLYAVNQTRSASLAVFTLTYLTIDRNVL